MNKFIPQMTMLFLFKLSTYLCARTEMETEQMKETELSLITDTPKEDFLVAIQLSHMGATSSKPWCCLTK